MEKFAKSLNQYELHLKKFGFESCMYSTVGGHIIGR